MSMLQYRRIRMAEFVLMNWFTIQILECSLAISPCHSQPHVPASNSAADATTDVIVLPMSKIASTRIEVAHCAAPPAWTSRGPRLAVSVTTIVATLK